MDSLSQIRKSSGFRLMVLFSTFTIGIILTAVVGEFVQSISSITERERILTVSSLQCILAFCLPAILTARFSVNRPYSFLGLNRFGGIKTYIGIIIVFILFMPAMDWLIEWNQNVHFPDWAQGVERYLRGLEETSADVSESLLQIDGFIPLIVTVGVVGVLTGFSEEVFFRGALQNVFASSRCGTWFSIFAAAFIFSFMHFQFFGFLPRLLMGMFFGYVLATSGSLWPSFFAHALNNSIVVVSAFILGAGNEFTLEKIGVLRNGIPWDAILSAAVTSLFLYKFGNVFFGNLNTGKDV